MDVEAAASRVASESSNGTWIELQVEGSVTDRSAAAFAIDGNHITVAYAGAVFEDGNVAQIHSCIAGNITGMKAVDNIRLLDCDWPEKLTTSFPDPQFGVAVRNEIFDAGDRPITATVPKPKVGVSTDRHVQVGRVEAFALRERRTVSCDPKPLPDAASPRQLANDTFGIRLLRLAVVQILKRKGQWRTSGALDYPVRTDMFGRCNQLTGPEVCKIGI